jgi:hypothetical protein
MTTAKKAHRRAAGQGPGSGPGKAGGTATGPGGSSASRAEGRGNQRDIAGAGSARTGQDRPGHQTDG